MAKLTAREGSNQRLFNHTTGAGAIELHTEDRDITFLKITNITTNPLVIDLFLERTINFNNTQIFFILKDFIILDGAGVEFQDDDIFIPEGYRLMVRTPDANSFTAIYKLK